MSSLSTWVARERLSPSLHKSNLYIYVVNNKKNQVEIIYCLLYLSGRRKTILLLVALSRPDEGICLYM